jgi:hypothetical protein
MDDNLSYAVAIGLSLLELPVENECLCHTGKSSHRLSSLLTDFTL